MAFFECHFFSECLRLNVSAYVLLPQQTTGQQIGVDTGRSSSLEAGHPTLYLLHGLSDDHTIWMRRTSIERYAAAKGLAVVMPAVNRSLYANTAYGINYWNYVSEELPRVMQEFFPLSAARERNFAAGLSMGGYGALRLGLANPDNFAAVASLSGALKLPDMVEEARRGDGRFLAEEINSIFGADVSVKGSEVDLTYLTETNLANGATLPAIYICCGTEDFLYPHSVEFREFFRAKNIPVTYEEGPGAHHWDYWDLMIPRVLDWLPLQASSSN